MTPFERAMSEIAALQARKRSDYGRDSDPWANIRVSVAWGIPAWVYASIQADHKSNRIQTFVAKGELANEPVRDALIDRCVYAIAALVLYDAAERERWSCPSCGGFVPLEQRAIKWSLCEDHITEDDEAAGG